MKNAEAIKITNENGEVLEAYAITVLRNPKDDKKYLLYTFNLEEEDFDIYAAIVDDQNETYVLKNITNEEDWNDIQIAINKIIGE